MPLKLVTRAGSDQWYVRGTVRGRRVFETTGTSDRRLAEEIRAKREAEVLNETVHGPKVTTTFAKAALAYLEAGGSPRYVAPLVDRWGSRPLSDITQGEVEAAAQAIYPKATAETRNRQAFTPFIAIYRFAEVAGLAEPRRWVRPRQTALPRDRWCTPEEVGALVQAAAPHMKPLVTFLAYTGARVGEALALDWKDVDLKRAWVVFRLTKRKRESRGVPLHPLVVAALGEPGTGHVFKAPHGGPYYTPRTIGGGKVKTAWAGMCRRAGVEGVTPHTLRHTFATWLTEAGVSEPVRDELMGHASSATGRRYAHVPRKELVEAVAKLPDLLPHIKATD